MSLSPVFQIALLALAGTLSVEAAGKWDYTNPDHWDGMCQTGKHQSPIDLDSSKSVTVRYEELAFINYEEQLDMQIINNGHTVQYNIDHPKATILASGGLPGIYYFAQMHFHWGSEHTVVGQRLPLEAHLVHYKREYLGIGEAVDHVNGLAVIGIMFKEDAANNSKLEPLISTLEQVNGVVNKEFPVTLVPDDLFPEDLGKFYRYQGSLTTPSCAESVVWTVLGNYVPISKYQYKRFQAIRVENGPMGNNYRPTQRLNGRPVFLTLNAGIDAGAFSITPVTPLLAGSLLAVYSHFYL